MKRLLLSVFIASVQIAFAQPFSGASGPITTTGPTKTTKVSPDLPISASWQLIDVIVQFQSNGNKQGTNFSNFNQAAFNNNVNQVGQSGQVKATLPAINAVHMQLPLALVQLLQANPMVKYITPNRPIKKTLDITTQTVNAELAWNLGWDGTGVGVAVIDSGITPVQDLTDTANNSRIVYSQSFISGVSDPTDAYGHGTHVAGIIGSRGADSTGSSFTRSFKGVAPGVNLINLRVLDQNGQGQESDVINAIQTAIALKNTYNIRVINLSLGTPIFESYTLDPLCQAVEAAWNAGIVVVVAAGNDGRDNSFGNNGYGTINAPGNDPYVITVGAMNTMGTPDRGDDVMTTYSSKGPTAIDHIVKPDIVAPGNKVISLYEPGYLEAQYPQNLVPLSYYQSTTSSDTSTS